MPGGLPQARHLDLPKLVERPALSSPNRNVRAPQPAHDSVAFHPVDAGPRPDAVLGVRRRVHIEARQVRLPLAPVRQPDGGGAVEQVAEPRPPRPVAPWRPGPWPATRTGPVGTTRGPGRAGRRRPASRRTGGRRRAPRSTRPARRPRPAGRSLRPIDRPGGSRRRGAAGARAGACRSETSAGRPGVGRRPRPRAVATRGHTSAAEPRASPGPAARAGPPPDLR